MIYYIAEIKALYVSFRIRCKPNTRLWYRCMFYFICFAVPAVLFFTMARYYGITNMYEDITAHISFAKKYYTPEGLPLECRAYPLTYLLLAWLGNAFSDYDLAAGLIAGMASLATMVVIVHFLRYYLKDICSEYVLLPFATALMFVWPLNIPILTKMVIPTFNYIGFYLAAGTTTPYHNLTANAVKPFIMLTIFAFFWLINEFAYLNIQKDDAHSKRKQNIVATFFAIVLLLSVLAKPSFYQFFAITAVIIVVGFWPLYGNKAFGLCFKIGLAFVPATAFVLVQMFGNLTSRGAIGIMPFYLLKTWSANIPISVIIGNAFAIFVLLMYIVMRKKSCFLLVGWLSIIIAFLEANTFVELEQLGCGNFFWGYFAAQFVLVVLSFVEFIKLKECFSNSLVRYIYLTVGGIILLAQAKTGLMAFMEHIIMFVKNILQLV